MSFFARQFALLKMTALQFHAAAQSLGACDMKKQLLAISLTTLQLALPVIAYTRQGDALIAQARQFELRGKPADLEKALALAQQALETDRSDIAYQLEVSKLRAYAAQAHADAGEALRRAGKVDEAVKEFEKALGFDPSSIMAAQQLKLTRDALEKAKSGSSTELGEALEPPVERSASQNQQLFSRAIAAPSLNIKLQKSLPLIKVNGQVASEVFLALGREAKLRVLFDPEYQNRPLGLNQEIDFRGLDITEALDYLSLITKSFWKPLSSDTVFVATDDPLRHTAYEEQVTKALYLTNAPSDKEVTDIGNTIQRLTDIKKLQVHADQNVIVARADADRMALAEKLVADLDKPKAEIIIDVVILSVTKDFFRQLGPELLGLGNNGSTTALFNPRSSLNPAQVGGRTGVPLDQLENLALADFNLNLPGAALDALLQTNGTKVLDNAQLRTVEGETSSLHIGQRVPYATGSFLPGGNFSGSGSALVNTQFQFLDVGLNIDVLARVHEPDEVSLHIESDQSSVTSQEDIGGLVQPVLSERKRTADVRVKEGEINFWDIVTEHQSTRANTGIPGLSQIPFVGRLFTDQQTHKSEYQVLTLLIPHIIRAPDIRDVNLKGLMTGTEQNVRMRYENPQPSQAAPRDESRVVELPQGPGAFAQTPVAGQPYGMTGQTYGTQVGAPGSFGGMSAAPQSGPFGGMAPNVAPVRLSFRPANLQSAVGGSVTVELIADGGAQVSSGTVAVQFDPVALQLQDLTAGSGVSEHSASSRAGGLIVLTIGAGADSRSLATLRFKVLSQSRSRVQISGSRLLNGQQFELPVQNQEATIDASAH